MKTNWQTKKLGDILKLEYGKPLPDLKRKVNGKYPVFGANGEKDRSDDFYFDKPSIIVGRKGSAGELTLVQEKFWPLDVTYFATFDDKKYDLKFLYNLLETLELPKLAKGVKPGINRNDIYSIEVNIPPLPEQKRIVKILDEAFEKIEKAKENAEKNLKNSKEIFESYLHNIFAPPSLRLWTGKESLGKDWGEKKLKEIGKTQTGLTPKTSNKKYYGNFVPFITPADIDILGDGSIRYDSKGLSEEGLEVGRKIEKNSVLMVCIGATIGKVGFATQMVSCNQQINTLTPESKYEAKLFYYILSTKSFFNKVIKSSSQATLPIINKGKWENLIISFPKSISEQQAIVKKLDALSEQTKKLEGVYAQKLADLEELKKSILNKAFSGEL